MSPTAAPRLSSKSVGFARGQGGGKLIDRLKNAGHYPYSDLEREPVA